MARKIGNKHTLCRRVGEKLCGSDKCPAIRRPYPPGAHGPSQAVRRPKLTAYGLQLREKQKAKFIYGIMERQFRSYVKRATEQKGDTGTILIQLLERRLDNVAHRLGLAKTRAEARQLVRHGHIAVNGRTVDIPSFSVKPTDAVTLRHPSERALARAGADTPSWLVWEASTNTGRVNALPEGHDLHVPFDPKPIIEFYSR